MGLCLLFRTINRIPRCDMAPFVLVTVEDNAVQDSVVVGDSKVSVIVVDFDSDIDGGEAQALVDEIKYQYSANEPIVHPGVLSVIKRLEDIIDGDEAEFEGAEDDLDDDEDYDDEDYEDDYDLEDDEKSDEDYEGDDFNVPAPVFPTPNTVEAAEFGPKAEPGPFDGLGDGSDSDIFPV